MIKCIVIEDEPLARKGLAEYISEIDYLELTGVFDNPLSAISSSLKGDLYFLDIEMPKMSGFEYFRTFNPPPLVIFTTAYPQYAVEGFNVNAVDYLLKPISFERFVKSVNKVKELMDIRVKNSGDGSLHPGYLYIKADNALVKIMLDDILFVEAVQNYISIQVTGRKYLAYLTFHAIEEWLPPGMFIKTHKSFIVSANKIDKIEGSIIFIKDYSIPISRNLKDDVMEKLLRGRFLKR